MLPGGEAWGVPRVACRFVDQELLSCCSLCSQSLTRVSVSFRTPGGVRGWLAIRRTSCAATPTWASGSMLCVAQTAHTAVCACIQAAPPRIR